MDPESTIKVTKQKVSDAPESSLKPKKCHDNHVENLINQCKASKDKEYRKRMEIAEEVHAKKIAKHKELLKSVTIERHKLELEKMREEDVDVSSFFISNSWTRFSERD